MSDQPEGFEIVVVGEHEIPMSTKEAAALTEEDRVQLVADINEANLAVEQSLAVENARHARASEAAAEKGPVLVRIWCAECGQTSSSPAAVRQSSSGLIFEGSSPVGMDAEQKKQVLERLRARTGQRVPNIAEGRVHVLLDEGDLAGNDWPPRAHCPAHGPLDIEVDELRRAALTASANDKRTKLIIHPRGRTAH